MPEHGTSTMLVAYDGTNRARRALTRAAELLSPRSVELITAWEPVSRQTARALGRSGLRQTSWENELDNNEGPDEAESHALEVLREGVELAHQLGLEARAHLVETSGTTPQAIVDAAKELDVDVIVAGTRAIGGMRSWFNNSKAESILQNAGLPVFIVPPTDEEENEDAQEDDNPLSAY